MRDLLSHGLAVATLFFGGPILTVFGEHAHHHANSIRRPVRQRQVPSEARFVVQDVEEAEG